ncbi:MAG TPA: hypothetical protein VFW33_14175, partial [Gemmataceae bacterium]|nr:hypothetical protein [Gemmataceae bacterium]
MPLTQASRELAARSGTRQVEVVLRADQVAHAVDRAVLQIWRDLLRLARPVIVPGGLAHAREMAHHTANALPHLIAFYVGERLRKLAEWGRNGSVSNVCRSVPAHALRALAVRRGVVRLTRLREAEGEPEIGLGTIDVLAPFRFGLPLDSPSLSLGSLVAILFPPPTEHQVDQVVYASGWQQRIGQGTHLAGPDRIAGVLA